MRLAYAHIPKCAGSKTRKALSKLIGFSGRNPVHRIESLDKHYKFVNIRHPMSWYVSLWSFKLTSTKYQMKNSSFRDMIIDLLKTQSQESLRRWHKPLPKYMIEVLNFVRKDLGVLSVLFIRATCKNWKEVAKRKDAADFVIKNFNKISFVDKVIRLEHYVDEMTKLLEETENTKKKINLTTKINTSKHKSTDHYYDAELEQLVRSRERLIITLFYNIQEEK